LKEKQIKKQLWFNEKEQAAFEKKFKKSKLKTKAQFIRQLILDYQPKEKPGDDFYEALFPLKRLGIGLNNITRSFHRKNYMDNFEIHTLRNIILELNRIMDDVRERFIENNEDD